MHRINRKAINGQAVWIVLFTKYFLKERRSNNMLLLTTVIAIEKEFAPASDAKQIRKLWKYKYSTYGFFATGNGYIIP